MLTPEEEQIVAFGTKSGKSKEAILGALSDYRLQNKPVEQPKTEGPGIVSRAATNAKKFVSGSVDTIKEQAKGLKQDISKIAGKDANLGFRDIPELALSVAGRTGKAVGGIAAKGVEATAKTVLNNEEKQKIKDAIATAIQSTTGQKVVGKFEDVAAQYGDWKKLHPEAAMNVENTLGIVDLATTLAGVGAAKKTAVVAGEQAAKVGQKALETGLRATESTLEAGSKLATKVGEKVKPITEAVASNVKHYGGEIAQIPSRIATNAAEKKAFAETVKALPSEVARKAAVDGVDIADIKTIQKAADLIPEHKQAAKELLQTVKKVGTGEARPEDVIQIVGKQTTKGIAKASKKATQIGEKLKKVSEKLGSVSEEELRPAVLKRLQETSGLEGLKLSKSGKLDFTDTVLFREGAKGDRKAINDIFKEATKAGSGKQKHLLRQGLFEELGGKKKSLSAITDTIEKAYDNTRKGIADVLETKNSAYKTLNKQYATVSKPLKDLRKILKSEGIKGEKDLVERGAGLLARRLTSTAGSNPQIEGILRALDKAAGTTTEKGTKAMQELYNVLNRYYDIAPKTGFQGLTKGALEGNSTITGTIIKGAKDLAGESPAVRQKAIENLLKEILG